MKIRELLRSFPSLRANLVMGAGTGVRIISGFTKTKVAALFLGVPGLGIIGIGGQMQLLGLTWGSLSIGTGFIRSYGAALADANEQKRKEILSTTFSLLCGANIAMALAVVLCRHWLSRQLFGEGAYANLILAVLVGIPFQVLIGAYFQGILFAHGRYDDWSKANAVGAVAEVSIFVLGVIVYGVEGAFWAIGVATAVWAICVFTYCLRVEPAKNMLALGVSLQVIKDLASSSLAASVTSTFAYFSGMLIRVRLLSSFGADLGGAYQASCVISGLYIQLVTNGIWAGFFPLIGKQPDKAVLDSAWAESLTVTAGLTTIFQTGILFAPALLLTVFFSKDFLHAGDFLAWQLLGDFFFLLAQPSLAYLLGAGRFLEYACVWCSFYGLSIVFPFVLFPFLGPQAVTIGYFALSVGLAAYSISIFAKRRPAIPRNFWLLLSLFAITAIAPALFFLSFPQFRLLQALICAICGPLAAFLFVANAKLNLGAPGLGLRTAFFNALRAAILFSRLDFALAKICAITGVPGWVVKFAPNHYQYPRASYRRVSREDFQYELDLGDFLDWHVYYGKMEGAKDRLYDLAQFGDFVIDVGANIGETALHLSRRVGAGGRVVAFEPDPLMREKCRRNISLNAAGNICLEPFALSDETRTYLLHRVSERNPAGNRILLEPENNFSAVEVNALRLDEYARRTGLGRVSLVKIDVEGFEERVLKGAENLIKRERPKLFVELSEANLRAQGTSSMALVRLLEEWNYEVVEAVSGKPIENFSAELHCDVVCIPRPTVSSNSSFT